MSGQVTSIDIACDHSPARPNTAGRNRDCVHGIRMIVIAMLDDPVCGAGNDRDSCCIGCKIGRPKPMRAREPAHELPRFAPKAPELKVAQPSVKPGIGMQRNPTRLEHRISLKRSRAN